MLQAYIRFFTDKSEVKHFTDEESGAVQATYTVCFLFDFTFNLWGVVLVYVAGVLQPSYEGALLAQRPLYDPCILSVLDLCSVKSVWWLERRISQDLYTDLFSEPGDSSF